MNEIEVIIKDLLPGVKYIVQARSKTVNGLTSPWSNSFRIMTSTDTIACAPITALTWSVNGSSFIGTWTKPTLDANGNPLKDFNGYAVTLTANSISKTYIVMQERFDFDINQNIGAFGNPEPIVQISVKARDIAGNLSTAVTATATNAIPANVTGLTATGVPLAISLRWDASIENDFKTFEIYSATSGSGFTPGSGNLISKTTSNSLVFAAADHVIHYFKVRQLDLFNQPCSAYASVSATPLNSTELDTTPPNAPSAVTVSSSLNSSGDSTYIDVSWTASSSTNLAGYVIRYSIDAISWQYINVPSNQTSAKINNLNVNTQYYVSVASISFVSSYSTFVNAATYPITTTIDSTAPSTPTAPTVSFGTSLIQVSHNLTKSGGGNLENDVRYLEVHGSTSTGFTPNSSTRFGEIEVAAPGVAVSANFAYSPADTVTTMYWKVIAVDYSGNKSVASAQSTGVPGLIQGANIADATITNAKIGSLSASKLTAGTAFINDLSVQSALTLDAVTGFIKSTNFNIASKTGWRLDQNGLVIYDGSIAAKSLLLQNGNNITPAVFADFEFNSDYYHDTSNVGNPLQLTASSGMLLAIQFTGQKTGNQSLRVYNTSITSATTHRLHFATGGQTSTGVNIDVNIGDYIYSVWAKKNGAVDQNIKLALYTDTGVAIASANILVNSTTMTRYSAVLTVPTGVNKVKQYMEVTPVTTGYDIAIDDLQLEPKLTAETAPSAWKPPSTTVIDGGSIITGSIRSSAASATVSGQPAWSINTQGNMQIGDALVRGKLIVGATNETKNILLPTYTSFEDTAASYYNVSTNVPNSTKFTSSAGNLRLQQQTTGSPPQGTNALRIFGTGFSTGLLMSLFFGAAGVDNVNIVPGQTYIVSAWIKTNDATKILGVNIGLNSTPTGYINGLTSNYVPTTTWTRVSGTLVSTTNLMTFFLNIQLGPSETAMDISIDGVQLEVAPVGVTTPSTWELGLSGGSAVQSTNYVAGSKGWVINSDGSVEFNSATIRGNLVVTGPAGNIKTSLDGTYPTIFFNSTDTTYAFINAASTTGSTKASLGMNSASYLSSLNAHVLRPRLWMPDTIRLELRDETAGATNSQGGLLFFSETLSQLSFYNSSNSKTSHVEQNSSGISVRRISSGTDLNVLNMDSTGTFLNRNHTNGAALNSIDLESTGTWIETFDTSANLKGRIKVGDTDIVLGTDSNKWVIFDFASGHMKNGFYPGWNTIGFGNGWSSRTGGNFATAAYRVTPDGRIVFRGSAIPGTKTDGTSIAAMPTVHWPPNDVVIPAAGVGSGARIFITITGGSAGNLQIYGFTGGDLGLDGVSYSLLP